MEILKAKIDYKPQFSNSPTLQVLVDSLECMDHMVYQKDNRGLYFSEKDGFVNFFYYIRPDNGYAGRQFTLQIEQDDGSVKEEVLIGPWSSRAGVMNRVFDTQCVEVSITDDPEAYDRGYTFCGGAITLEKAKEAINKIQGAALFKAISDDGEITYIPTKLGSSATKAELTLEHVRK